MRSPGLASSRIALATCQRAIAQLAEGHLAVAGDHGNPVGHLAPVQTNDVTQQHQTPQKSTGSVVDNHINFPGRVQCRTPPGTDGQVLGWYGMPRALQYRCVNCTTAVSNSYGSPSTIHT